MGDYTLILIDIQNIYFEDGKLKLYKPEEAAIKANRLLEYFRRYNLNVVHVKHFFSDFTDYNKSSKELNDISRLVYPIESEEVITKFRPNAFYNTKLDVILKEMKTTNIIIVGMMSHMCVDSTARAASELGYKVFIAEDACTTMSLSFNGNKFDAITVHKNAMAALNNTFARILPVEDIISKLNNSN